jgi:hypothetical protein
MTNEANERLMIARLLTEHPSVEVAWVDLTTPINVQMRSELIDAFHRNVVYARQGVAWLLGGRGT